jgi:NAD(P)-dependent dehydrogenase (short-subunit alcohol dehydrogenase family)
MDYKEINLRERMSVENKVVVLTGAAGGIGSAAADCFAQVGAKLLLVDLVPEVEELAASLKKKYGIEARGLIEDLRSPGMEDRIAEACVNTYGGADVLINNAGAGFPAVAVEDIDQVQWDQVMYIYLKAPFLLSKTFAKRIMLPKGKGRIINTASQAGMVAIEEQADYCVAKAALIALTRSCACEWGPKGVTVCAIAPTIIGTPGALAWWTGEKRDNAYKAIPLRRFGDPWEVGAAMVYLAGDAAQLVNGTCLVIDGGYTVH